MPASSRSTAARSPTSTSGRPWRSRSRVCCPGGRSSGTSLSACRGVPPPRRVASASTSSSASCSSRTRRRCVRARSPAAWPSARRSRVPSPATRGCCCSTSRSVPSTRSLGSRCRTCCSTSTRPSPRRSCSSRTMSTRRSRLPIGSCCSARIRHVRGRGRRSARSSRSASRADRADAALALLRADLLERLGVDSHHTPNYVTAALRKQRQQVGDRPTGTTDEPTRPHAF